MSRRPYELKRGKSFFAAGEEFGRALRLLGDGAFKLFAWVCLRAERATGRLAFDRAELAAVMGRSRRTLGRHLGELVQAGVCELQPPPNQHGRSVLRVRPEFWPYTEVGSPQAAAGAAQATERGTGDGAQRGPGPTSAYDGPASPGEAAYLAGVRQALLRPSCVQSSFSLADKRLARSWHRAGVRLLDVQRAILLGSVRRSISMVNWNSPAPVVSLRYFENTLQEVLDSEWPQGYWQHVERQLETCEEYWRRHAKHAPPAARPNLSQAEAGGRSTAPVDRGEEKKKGEEKG